MNTRWTLMLAGVIALAGTALAIAAPSANEEAQRFPISLSDAQQRATERFANLDANGDAQISLEEFLAGKAERKHHHRRGNRNHRFHSRKPKDATLSSAERKEQHAERRAKFEQALFETMDLDGDGALSPAEASSENRRTAKQQVWRTRHFERLDVDNSRSLDSVEFNQRLRRLQAADTNADGLVSRDELRAMRHSRQSNDA